MKYLMVVAVVGIVLWLLLGRQRRGGGGASGGPSTGAAPRQAEPVAMLECSHCKLHLPRAEARFDAAGRPYCCDAHRAAGPR